MLGFSGRKWVLYPFMLFLFACGNRNITKSTYDVEPTLLDTIEITATREYRASAKRENDLLHTKLEVSFDWSKQYLYGKATLTLKPYFYPVSKLTLDAKGFDIHQVALVRDNQLIPLRFTYDSLQLFIDLDRTYTRDEQYTVFIDYTAKPNELPEGGSAAISGDKGLYFINPTGEDKNKPQQIWTQGETEASSCWFPTIDKPNENTTQEIYITVDNRFVTLSNGVLVSSEINEDGTRTDYWKMDLPHAPYLFMMAVGEFSKVTDYWEGMEVSYYVEPKYEPYARDIFGNTPEMLTFYSNLLGVRYPWPKYSQVVVRDFVSGAMENTTATVHFSGLQRTRRELLDGDYEDIIAHELFHHWFGDLVTCESWSNLPLNESFATYGEYLWIEYKYGRDEADYHLDNDLRAYLAEARSKTEPLIRFYYDDKEDMFDAHSYQKGGRVLHMLRKYTGDEAFFAALKLYLEENAFNPVEIHHLRLAFEKVTGEDLNWFFNQWFLNDGHPQLTIDYLLPDSNAFIYPTDTQWVKVVVSQRKYGNDKLTYRLPFTIDIYTKAGKQSYDVVLDDPVDTFKFIVEDMPYLINVDAEKMLLCTKEDNKPFRFYTYQYEHAPLFMDRKEALEAAKAKLTTSEQARRLILDALDDPFWALRSTAVDAIDFYYFNDTASITRQLTSLATNDPESKVRADAIEALASLKDKSYLSLFEKALNDSSYMVEATALKAIYDLDKDTGLAYAEKFESGVNENSSLLSTLGEIYADAVPEGKSAFFTGNIKNADGFNKFLLLQNFGEYASKSSPEIAAEAIDLFRDIALNENTWWIRYSAMNAIFTIRDELESRKNELEKRLNDVDEPENREELEQIDQVLLTVNEAIEEIKDKETNPRLKGYINAN